MCKSINIIHYINRIKDKYAYLNGKIFDKIQFTFTVKYLIAKQQKKKKKEGAELPQPHKNIYEL